MVVHAFNSSPQETETGGKCSVFKVSLACVASTRLAILFLDIYQREMKTYKKNLCTNIHNQYSDTCVQCQQMGGKKSKSLRADWAT